MSGHHGDHRRVPPPQGTYAGLPVDWRLPSLARARARLWNPGDPRVLTPKSFGWGWAINFYWLTHPVRLARGRRAC
jgi:uncharacterized protein DUF5808